MSKRFRSLIIRPIAWVLARLARHFPNTVYVEVYVWNKIKPATGTNIRLVRWHPAIVDKLVKSIGIVTASFKSSQF